MTNAVSARHWLSLAGLVVFGIGALMPAGTARGQDLATEDEKILYSLGVVFSQRLRHLGFDDAEIERIVAGARDALAGNQSSVDMSKYGLRLNGFLAERAQAVVASEAQPSQAFLEAASKESGARVLPSGLVYRETQAGTGDAPNESSSVRVHYQAELRDGTVFDSSRERGKPDDIEVARVLPCWKEALLQMKVGTRAVVTCPAALAFGSTGTPDVKPGAAVRFDLELVEVIEGAAQAPESDTPPPTDAQ